MAREPLLLMEDAVAGAALDAGSRAILGAVDLVCVVRGAWNYSDPGRLIAERIGSPHAVTAMTAEGGNAPQQAVNEICRRIVTGRCEVAVVVGGEGIYSRRRSRATGIERTVTRQSGVQPDDAFGQDVDMSSDLEKNAGFVSPVNYYALFENAWRADQNLSVAENRRQIADLLTRFNAIAQKNPSAWSHQPYHADDLLEVTEENRMVCFPYTKRMCSNWFTDQAAAVILCSVEAARRLSTDTEGWVFPLAGTDAHDTLLVSHRESLAASPAIRVGGRVVLELAGVAPGEIEHVDLYSCFPSAVQVAAHEIGLSIDRRLSVTGGMAYFGGPLSNYVTHSLSTMVDTLRSQPKTRGLVTANGGYLTKHSFGVYSTKPPSDGYLYRDVQAEVKVYPTVRVAESFEGSAIAEATTVAYERDGSSVVLAACRSADGARVWGRSSDSDAVRAASTTEMSGTEVIVDPEGIVHFEA
jgi:acetyl-CoA C-acetyltransferase